MNLCFAQDVELSQLSKSPHAAYARSEWTVDPAKHYKNPFDPTEVSIDAHFTGPNGKSIVVPAFWAQNFTNNRHGHHEDLKPTAAGEGQFRIRFAPPAAGQWMMKVVIKDSAGVRETKSTTITVAENKDARGFIRRADNSRYLKYDNGASFFPVGLNIAWPHADPGISDYEKWFKSLGDAGGNYCRIWMTHPNRMTETKEAGIGRFDLAAMQYYDDVFNLAEKHNIAFMVCFNNHRDLLARDQYGESIWGRFPYNAANGGPATQPSDFITNADAREFYKRRLRYVIGRYSAYTNLAFWEFFNEQEFTRVEVTTDWMREMSSFMKTHDPYQHLVTTSSKVPDEQWQLDSIDITQSHLYVGGSSDLIGPVSASIRRHDKFNKPHLVAELGIGAGGDADKDPTNIGTAIHHGLWSATFAGGAGTAGHWWWDNYIEPRNLWHVYTGIAKFSAAVDWANRDFKPIDLPLPTTTESADEQFYDLKLSCSENWGYITQSEIEIRPNGQLNQALPHYFVSPQNRALHNPVRMRVDLAKPTTLVLNVSNVCDVGVMRVAVGEDPLIDFPFSALPGAPDQKRTRPRPEGRKIFEATFDVQRSVEIPAGKHVVSVGTVAGDWVSLESIVLKNALSSRHQLATLALQDESAGETIVWMYDVRAHWQADRDGVSPRKFEGVSVDVPVKTDSSLTAIWWNTRSGEIIETKTVNAAGGVAKVVAPPFTRDIAVILRRAG